MSDLEWLEDEDFRPTDYEWALIEFGVLVFPTDTVYGLMAHADSSQGYAQIYHLKGRDFGKPLALLVARDGALHEALLPKLQFHELVDQFDAGLLTAVLPEKLLPQWLLDEVISQPGPIGFRCPNHSQLQELLKSCRLQCVWATSVNRSGQSPATTADEVLAWLEELKQLGIDPPELVVLSRTPTSGTPSRVVDLTGDEPKWIR